MNVLKIITKLFNRNKKDKKDLIIEELTKKEEQKDQIILTTMWVFLTILLAFFLMICLLAVLYMPEGPTQLVVIIVSTIILLIGGLYCLKLEVEAGYYECKKCNHRHKPNYNKVLWSMHIGTTRYLKCPECGNKSWSKKVISK
jgi:hypothetical protein